MARTRMDDAGRIVLPKDVREGHGLRGGQEFDIRFAGAVVMLVPIIVREKIVEVEPK
jgi:AbrB family looped-hinge helix DNA binding protein